MKVSRPIRPIKKKISAPTTARASSAAPPGITHKLHKLLAQAGLGSRREMEELIATGQVTINGKAAEVGSRDGPEDVVRMGRRTIQL